MDRIVVRARMRRERRRPSPRSWATAAVAVLTMVLLLGTALPASSLPSVTDSPHPEPSAAQSTAQQTTDEAPSPAQTSALEETPEPSGTPEGTSEAPVAPSTTEGAVETPGSTTPDAGSSLEASAADDTESQDATAAEEDGISILALGPDGAQPPYVYWTATAAGALIGGATFRIQGPRSDQGQADDDSGWRWNANEAVVTDCVAAPCVGPDLDPDLGEFLVKSFDGHDVRGDRRYRVRQETAPAGYQMRNENNEYRKIAGVGQTPSQGAWQNRTYGFGAFVHNKLDGKPLSCAAGTFYSIQDNGTVRGVVNGVVSDFGSFGRGLSSMNGLAIGENGSVMYAMRRAANASNVAGIYRYTAATGVWEALLNTGYQTGNSQNLVAGAVDLSNGNYLFGGFHNPGSGNLQFRLHEFDPGTNEFRFVGYVDAGVPASSTSNGDMAFDSQGTLYIVRSGSTTNIISVDAGGLASANGGLIPASATSSKSLGTNFSSVNGIAFHEDGTGYLGNATTVYRYNATLTQVGGRVTDGLGDSSDLASCSSPASLTVQKNIVGRLAPADQFTLTLRQGTTQQGSLISTATTEGSALGVQAKQIGPVPAQTNTSYWIGEAMATGSASSLDKYATSYVCADDDGIIVSGSAASGTVTMPNKPGVAVVCTFTNSPLVATVNINKVELDAEGLNPQPASGWTVGTSATATTGTATLDPAAPTQQTNATGSATWRVNFSATNARATINVSETQKPGYAFVDGQCTVTPLGGEPGGPIDLPSEAGTAIPGVAPGDTVDCTFTNKLNPTTLTLAKEVPFGDDDPAEWTLQATGPSGSLPGPNGTTGTADATADVTPGVAYTLTESGGPDTYIADGDWVCLTDTDDPVTVTDGQVALASGDQVTCTISNATAQLTLLKHVEDPALDPSDWELTAEPEQVTGLNLGTETVVGAGTASDENTFYVRPNHSYTISEELAAQPGTIAFRALGIEKLVQGEWVAVDSDEITLEPGEQATYRFVNDSLPEIILPLTGGLASDTFLIAGAGVLLLALTLAALQRRRHTSTR